MALISGLAFGFLPPQCFFSAVPMSDGISNGLAYLGISFLTTGWSKRNPAQGLSAGLLCGLSLSLRPATLFFLFTPWLLFVFLSLKAGRLRTLWSALPGLLLGGIPGLWILLDNLGGITSLWDVFSSYYASVGSKDHILASIRNEGITRVLKFWIFWPFGSVFTGIMIQGLFFVGLIPLLRSPLRKKVLLVLLAISPYVAFALLKMNFLWASRYGLPILFVYFLLLPPLVKTLLGTSFNLAKLRTLCGLWILVSVLWMAPIIHQLRSINPPPAQAIAFAKDRAKKFPSILVTSSDLGGHIPSLTWNLPSILKWGRPIDKPWLGLTTHRLEAFPGKKFLGIKDHDKGWAGPTLFSASWNGEALKHLSRPRFSDILVTDESQRAIPWTGWFSPKKKGELLGRKEVSLLLPPNLDGSLMLHLQLRLTPKPGGGSQKGVETQITLLEDWKNPSGKARFLLQVPIQTAAWTKLFIPYKGSLNKVRALRLSVQDPAREAEDATLLARDGRVEKQE